MQSQRKQHQRILRTKAQEEHSRNLSERDPREVEHVTRVTIAKKVSKKNLKAKSPLRFTNKYRAVPSSSDLSERRVIRKPYWQAFLPFSLFLTKS